MQFPALPALIFGQSQHIKGMHVENYTPMEVFRNEAYQATRCGIHYDKISVQRRSSFLNPQQIASKAQHSHQVLYHLELRTVATDLVTHLGLL